VEFDLAFETAVTAFRKILDVLNPPLREYARVKVDASLFRLAFNCDPQELPPNTVRTDFIIERRAAAPYELNRYFCAGPFPTRLLISKLEEIEQALAPESSKPATA
jgi:hypothetical protein